MAELKENARVIAEIYQDFQRDHSATIDKILVSPDLREKFLARVETTLGEAPEEATLQTLLNLRKQAKVVSSRRKKNKSSSHQAV